RWCGGGGAGAPRARRDRRGASVRWVRGRRGCGRRGDADVALQGQTPSHTRPVAGWVSAGGLALMTLRHSPSFGLRSLESVQGRRAARVVRGLRDMRWQFPGGRRASDWGVALILGASAIGCTEEESALFILGNVRVEAPECIARGEGSAVLLESGVLDVALKADYVASLLVGTQLTPRGSKVNLRSETMITTIQGAEVHLYTDTGDPDPNSPEFTVPASGVLRPEASEDPGFGIVTATLIPAATGAALAADLTNPFEVRTRVAVVSVFGETIGGL